MLVLGRTVVLVVEDASVVVGSSFGCVVVVCSGIVVVGSGWVVVVDGVSSRIV